jgi:hypothetical protein
MQFSVGKPLVLTEVEINPDFLEVFRLASLDFDELLQERLISFLNLLAQYITVSEHFEPIFRNFLICEVVVFILLFLFCE